MSRNVVEQETISTRGFPFRSRAKKQPNLLFSKKPQNVNRNWQCSFSAPITQRLNRTKMAERETGGKLNKRRARPMLDKKEQIREHYEPAFSLDLVIVYP